MTTTSRTKHRDGDGRTHETVTTRHDSGYSKSVTHDITDRTLLDSGKLETVTTRYSNGDSVTRKF